MESDYNDLGLYLHSKEKNPTLEAAQVLWEFLPCWMAARKMAVADDTYNRSISGSDLFRRVRGATLCFDHA